MRATGRGSERVGVTHHLGGRIGGSRAGEPRGVAPQIRIVHIWHARVNLVEHRGHSRPFCLVHRLQMPKVGFPIRLPRGLCDKLLGRALSRRPSSLLVRFRSSLFFASPFFFVSFGLPAQLNKGFIFFVPFSAIRARTWVPNLSAPVSASSAHFLSALSPSPGSVPELHTAVCRAAPLVLCWSPSRRRPSLPPFSR